MNLVEVTFITNCCMCDKEISRKIKKMDEDEVWEKYPNHCYVQDGRTEVDYIHIIDFCSDKCFEEFQKS